MNYAGFRLSDEQIGKGAPEVEALVIKNSAALKLGMAVKLDPQTGVEPCDAVSDKMYGFVVGFANQKGLSLDLLTSGTDYDGTYSAGTPSAVSYTASADNQTDKKISALVQPVHSGMVLSALLDAAKGTTTGSDLIGCYFDILTSDARKLDESTATTTKSQFMSVPGRANNDPTDPQDPTTTRILVKVVEAQVPNNA